LNISIPDSNASRPHSGNTNAPVVPPGRMVPFLLVTFLFFLWGVPNNLNDILIRQFMKSFEINRLQAGLVQSAFYLGYFLLALPAGALMRRSGYKVGIITGLCLYGVGCFLFWPAAIVGQYWFFLTALFVIAAGLSFLETASSPFIAQLGDPETSEQRLNLAQAFNPLGSISAVLVGSRFIFSGIELKPAEIAALQAQGKYQQYLQSETLRVIVPFLVIGAIVLLWALLIARTPFPHTGLDYSQATIARDHSKPVWKRRHFVGAVISQFLYVGSQIAIWSYLIPYAHAHADLNERTAGYWLTGALGAFTVGRFVSTVLLKYVRANVLVSIFAVINTGLSAFIALHPGMSGVYCLIILSFFMAPMFPTIFALGIKGLGTRTKTGGSVLVMAVIGGAIITLVMGGISDRSDVAFAYLVPMVCFVLVGLWSWFLSAPLPEDMDTA
jgi:FHS family L-fucose permease-like MFS transporter